GRSGQAGVDTGSAPTRPCLLTARQYGADAGEAKLDLDRLGQVVVAPGHVGTAVDHRHRHRAAVVAELHLRPAGERLVSDAHRLRQQGAAAGDAVAVQTGPVI